MKFARSLVATVLFWAAVSACSLYLMRGMASDSRSLAQSVPSETTEAAKAPTHYLIRHGALVITGHGIVIASARGDAPYTRLISVKHGIATVLRMDGWIDVWDVRHGAPMLVSSHAPEGK